MGGKHVVESLLSTVSSFLMVTPMLRTCHIGTYRAVGGLQGKLITHGCEVFDFEAFWLYKSIFLDLKITHYSQLEV